MEKEIFKIEVMRIGYGYTTINVEAESQAEADKLALEEAGSHSYTEKHSDYKLSSHFDELSLTEMEAGSDYSLKKGHWAWISVEGLSVKIIRNPLGELQVEVFNRQRETEDPLAAINLHIPDRE